MKAFHQSSSCAFFRPRRRLRESWETAQSDQAVHRSIGSGFVAGIMKGPKVHLQQGTRPDKRLQFANLNMAQSK